MGHGVSPPAFPGSSCSDLGSTFSFSGSLGTHVFCSILWNGLIQPLSLCWDLPPFLSLPYLSVSLSSPWSLSVTLTPSLHGAVLSLPPMRVSLSLLPCISVSTLCVSIIVFLF